MAKKEVNIAQQHNEDGNGLAQQSLARITEDDNCLPTPAELLEYQKVNPDLVGFFMETARKEQDHRHVIESRQVKVIEDSSKRDYRVNVWGMFFAFLSIIVFSGIACYSLYLGQVWMATFWGGGTLVSVIAIFRGAPQKSSQKPPKKK